MLHTTVNWIVKYSDGNPKMVVDGEHITLKSHRTARNVCDDPDPDHVAC